MIEEDPSNVATGHAFAAPLPVIVRAVVALCAGVLAAFVVGLWLGR